jgi:FkbH-like protein
VERPAHEAIRLLARKARAGDPGAFGHFQQLATRVEEADQLLLLASLAKKVFGREVAQLPPVRMALMGACTFHPWKELLEVRLLGEGVQPLFFDGLFDNYLAEILAPGGILDSGPLDFILLCPAAQRLPKPSLAEADASVGRKMASEAAREVLALCHKAHERTRAEIILLNFPLPGRQDWGAFRNRTLATDWAFRRAVNLELGLAAPAFVQICDREYLEARLGLEKAEDRRGWFESKQPGSPALLASLATEAARLVTGVRRPMKKVLAVDLDNTLWGGVIGDDGLAGIELGDNSPRGEAFKDFQKYVKSLKDRGVLLAVCSKNDEAKALEPFEKHPEMVLKREDFVAFSANWEPKSENLRRMATELQLGLDSFVFADDNPAEIEIVRQFAPEVGRVLLGPDPADYVSQLQDSRFFEPRQITREDARRLEQYHAEAERKKMESHCTNMDSYLASLEMVGEIHPFRPVDLPRVAQLVAKSNQFNLTTRRHSEAELGAIMNHPDTGHFSVRLRDRFGDHGLISVVILRFANGVAEVDTWLMSCRVLKREVEEVVLNEMMRLAQGRGCGEIRGVYLPTSKNALVGELYPQMGFSPYLTNGKDEGICYTLKTAGFSPKKHHIKIQT